MLVMDISDVWDLCYCCFISIYYITLPNNMVAKLSFKQSLLLVIYHGFPMVSFFNILKT